MGTWRRASMCTPPTAPRVTPPSVETSPSSSWPLPSTSQTNTSAPLPFPSTESPSLSTCAPSQDGDPSTVCSPTCQTSSRNSMLLYSLTSSASSSPLVLSLPIPTTCACSLRDHLPALEIPVSPRLSEGRSLEACWCHLLRYG